MTMKRFLNILPLALAAILAVSCYDDSKVMERLDNLESRVDSLTAQVGTVETLINALESNVYIKAVTEVTGGYEIEFTDGKKITIKNGQNGADAPEISALKDADGIYYWTLDGEWLLDAEGNKVPAGMGQPKLKTENGQWYISADGLEWALIGPDVACTIKNVEVAEDAVTFTLANGDAIVIPIVRPLTIEFSVADGGVFEGSAAINYEIIGGTDKNRVVVMCSTAIATVEATDETTGVITVEDAVLGSNEIIVFVTDGVERTIFRTLKLTFGTLTVEEDVVRLGVEASTLTIPVVTSMDYDITIDSDWITLQEETKASEVRTDNLVFNVSANEALGERVAYIFLTPKDEAATALEMYVTVYQAGHAVKVWEKSFADYPDVTFGNPIHLAYKDGNVLVSTGSAIHLLNAETGAYVADGSAAIPDGFVISSMTNDDAGNIVIAGNIPAYATGDVYALTALDADPVKVATMQNDVYSFNAGNLRAGGDVTKNGVLSMFVDVSQYYIACDIVDGVAGTTTCGALANPASGTVWSSDNGCVAPLGSSLADGLLATYYCCPSLLSNATGEWVSVGTDLYDGNDNNCAIAKVKVGETQYAAVAVGAHFDYTASRACLYDLSKGEMIYKYVSPGTMTWLGVTADVLLLPGEDVLYMVFADLNKGTLACIQFPL